MNEIERDILLGRVADGEASPEDWTAFRAMAEADPTLWRELAELQRDGAELSSAVGRAIAVADTVEAPVDEHLAGRLRERFALIRMWGGWAAAAAVALAWGTGLRSETGGPNVAGIGAVGPAASTADDALKMYLDKGQKSGMVVGEMPSKVLLETRPLADGSGYEVLYVRQIVERARVNQLFRPTSDELGGVTPLLIELVPVRPNGAH